MITRAQKVIATVAMLAITATAAPVTANAAYHTTYTDVTPNDWFYSDVMTLSGQGVVNGVGDNQFDPYSPVTGDEFATMIVRSQEGQGFTLFDACRKAILRGWYDPSVGRDTAITREEAAVLLINSTGVIQWDQSDIDFPDRKDVSPEYVNAIDCALNLGLMEGDEDGNFNPQDTLSRAEACRMILNMQDKGQIDCNVLAPSSMEDLRIEYIGQDTTKYTFSALNNLRKVPMPILEHFIEHDWTLTFTPDIGIRYPQYPYAVGITSANNREIEVKVQSNSAMLDRGTIVHEFGHYLFNIMLDEDMRARFDYAYDAEAEAMEDITSRSYCKTSVGEFFAESFKAYILYAPFDDKAPMTYALLEEISGLWE